jgi:starch-binding outer membrane protein, SusD/RagB family
MKKLILSTSFLAALFGIVIIQSCTKYPNLTPTNDITSETVYANLAGYKSVLAKVYGSFALTGNQGPAGNGDVQGIDEGFSDFFRLFWKAQELSTDEAVISWGDVGIQDFHNMNWTSNNSFLTGLYYRSMYQITLCNEFIRQSADDQLSKRGISGNDADNIREFAREARFLRAFQYWVLMDLFGNPPFATEATVIGGAPPPRISRTDLFNYIESELKAIESSMPAPHTNEYGRADKAAAWALLARLYLNAEAYTGTPKYTDAITYSKKVIDAGFSLITDYTWLMRADNNLNTSNTGEFIFTINYDGIHTQGYGGTTFLTHACVGGSMPASSFGVGGGWSGTRATKNLPQLFPGYPNFTTITDKRAQFYTDGQNLEISNVTAFTDGLGVTKYKNIKRDGSLGSSQDFSDIDMPLFRLSEMYLIYAEGVLRGGTGGDAGTALSYINKMRGRAYANDPSSTSGNITSGQLNLDFILDERARELYWEGFRRTDLIRYNKFVEGSYLWPWKGGVASGTGVSSIRKLYPIPSREINSNKNLIQNPGY